VAGLNTLIRSQPSVLKTGFPIAIHIKNKTAQIGFHSKRPHGVPTSYIVVFLCSVCSLKMRDDCYVNIDGIDDHIRLSFFFHCNKMKNKQNSTLPFII
jgi:hypothetical protein